MDELKLKKDDDNVGVKKTFSIPVPELVVAITIVPLFMLLVYIGIASYTLQSILSFGVGSVIGWVIAVMISRTMGR